MARRPALLVATLAAAALLLLLCAPAAHAADAPKADAPKAAPTNKAAPVVATAAAAEAAQQAAARRFYRAVSAATAEFVKLQVEGGERGRAEAPPAAGKNGTAAAASLAARPMDVPNPLALIAPNQTAELVLAMYPVGASFAEKRPEAQQAAVRLRMEMAAATANLTAAVKLEQAQRALAASLAEGAGLLKALKAQPEGKAAAALCPLSAAAGKDARAACLAKAAADVGAKLNGTADVMSWLQWQESRLNTNLIFFLNWAFGANNVTDGRMLAPVVVSVRAPSAKIGGGGGAADGKAAAAAAAAAGAKPKVVDVLLFQGGGPLSKKTPEPPRGYDPLTHRLMDPTCALLAFWQVKNAASDPDIAAKIGDVARGKAGGSRWWNVASMTPPVSLRRFDCAPFTWEEWASGKRQ
jgi:hypothetical protein